MNAKQEKFCVEYMQDMNATQAAIRAGYAVKRADATAYNLLRNTEIKSRIAELRRQYYNDRIMSAEEIEYRLTMMARGEPDEEVIVVEGIGDGRSTAKKVYKKPSAKDQIKALELLAKRNQLFSDGVNVSIEPIVIVEDELSE